MFKTLLKLTVPLLIFCGSLKAQQLPLYSQYNMNKFLLNPAVVGTSGFTNVSLTAREQWIGFKGTPKTHSITVDSKIFPDSYISKTVQIKKKKRKSTRSGKVGVGGHLYNDHNGPIDRTGLEGAYAYHLNMDNTILSMGLSMNFFQLRLNPNKINLGDDDYDELVDGGKRRIYVPDASIGVFAIAEQYFAGISAINVLESKVQFGDGNQGDYKLNRQYNIMAGYRYALNDNLATEPSFLLKIPEGMRVQLDIQTKMIIKKDYWAGLSFRTGSALSIFGGLKYDRYYFGYAFDYNFNSMTRYTFGSHEIMAAVRFGDTARRYRWLNAY
jgi:type IX secretion system PorP/SprF family membrane protein